MQITGLSDSSFNRTMLRQRQTNIAATGQALERLSTGKRINRASDDPAGFIAAEELRGELTDRRAELSSYQNQRQSLNRQESTLASVQRQAADLRGLVVSAAGNLASDEQQAAVQQTIDAALQAIDLVAGDLAPESLEALRSGGEANLETGDPALAAEIVDAAADEVTTERVSVATEQRSVEIFEQLARDQIVITQQTLSDIEDADFAAEASNLISSQILTESATAALVYSQRAQADLIGSLLDEIDT